MQGLDSWIAKNGFLPHGYCFQWSADLLTLMVVSDAITALAYFSIPVALLFFLDRNKIQMTWLYLMFAAFIFFCGTTHIMDIITIWYPTYWLQAWIKAATGIVSLATAILIWPIVVKLGSSIAPLAEQGENLRLREEIAELKLKLAEKG